MKKQIFLLGMVFLIAFVAAAVSLDLTKVVFTPAPTPIGVLLNEGNVSFDCGGDQMVVYVSSGDAKIADDFEQVVGSVCAKEVTNVVDWNAREYKENQYGLKSFDENKLKKDICLHEGLEYDTKISQCLSLEPIEIVKESVGMDAPIVSNEYYCEDKEEYQECPFGISGGIGTRCYKTVELNSWYFCGSAWEVI